MSFGVANVPRVRALSLEQDDMPDDQCALSDEELAERTAKGDELAFATLVRRHAPRLGALASRRLRGSASSEDVEDVVSEVFFDAWRRRAEYDPSRSAYRTWLSWLLLGRMSASIRRSSIHREHISSIERMDANGEIDLSAVSTEIETILQLQEFLQQLQELPQADASLIVRRLIHHESFADIASSLGVSEGATRVRLSRALSKLRDQLSHRASMRSPKS